MEKKTFGTFAGVFTPTTLTILGVIMYIRHPWVVGNAGILGAALILFLSVAITFSTALSLSSITTNIRIGSGGAFSLISQSLGLEIGGAIGIPFYFAQAVAVAMYIFGFREGVQMLMPEANPLLLDISIFLLVMAIAFISTSFAFKIQFVILGFILLSLLSIYGSVFTNDLNWDFEWIGKFPGSAENNFSGISFWVVFAVFFPAVTGVMAGANMSGDLSNPRRSIPYGTIASVILTTLIYLSLIFVAVLIATPQELVSNYNLFIEKSVFPPIVLIGLLGATLSSALGSFVGAPRILLALGEKNILPKSQTIAKLTKKGEPYNAMLVTAVIVLIGISLRNLNTIAPLLTMFFMITYAMVNVVALIEQSLALPSFRPTLKVPIIVPMIGTFGSITIMFIMSPFIALVSLVLIVLFYYYLVKKRFKSDAGDSRSGLFTALAEWATKKTTELSPKKEMRSWRPDLLIPTFLPKEIRSSFKLIESIVYPKGSVKILALRGTSTDEQKRLEEFLPNVVQKFKEISIPISYTFVDDTDLDNTINVSIQALNSAFFKPNTIFLATDPERPNKQYYDTTIRDARKNGYGVITYVPFSTASLAIEKNITLWLTDIPSNWKETFVFGNNDLATLLAILIRRNWDGTIQVNVLNKAGAVNPFLEPDFETLQEMVRFPSNTEFTVYEGELIDFITQTKHTDLNIINIMPDVKMDDMVEMVNKSRISALFCIDSDFESALI